jgi:hypothetical protein
MKYLFFLVLTFLQLNAFQKVIIWGHKLHSHTHSYIHNAFYKAFNYLGYETYWFDDHDDVSSFNFANSLFIVEGQVDENIPLRNDCKYILHNTSKSKYESLPIENYIRLQVYTDDVLDREIKKIAPCIHYDLKGRSVYMPWATDLLPPEINSNIKKMNLRKNKGRDVVWIGTIGGGLFGNENEIKPYVQAAKKAGFKFKHKINISVEENMKLVKNSFMAPAIVGKWQQEKGYIPCRIFKNISYGKLGITNSKRVYELFEGRVVYNDDSTKLFFDALDRMKKIKDSELKDLVAFVRDNHTYINRINTLLEFFRLANDELKKT